jgi:hypothetical protein
LSWQLVVVMALFLNGFASSELESPDRVTDPIPISIDARTASTEKPLLIKISSVQHESFCINIYDSHQITKNKKKIFYYSPITLLQHKNVVFIHNVHNTTHGILSFSFSNSNQEVKGKGRKFIRF